MTVIQKPPEIQLPLQVLESALWSWSNEKARTEGTDGTRAVMSKLKDRGLEVLVRWEHLWNNSKWCRRSSETGILDCDPGKERRVWLVVANLKGRKDKSRAREQGNMKEESRHLREAAVVVASLWASSCRSRMTTRRKIPESQPEKTKTQLISLVARPKRSSPKVKFGTSSTI